jgi:hypothetical protein
VHFRARTYRGVTHAMDGIYVTSLDPGVHKHLHDLYIEGLGSPGGWQQLPKRTGQTFFDIPMKPFHPGMWTYYDVSAKTTLVTKK